MNMKRRVNVIDGPVLTFVYLTMLYFLDARNIAGYIIAVIIKFIGQQGYLVRLSFII